LGRKISLKNPESIREIGRTLLTRKYQEALTCHFQEGLKLKHHQNQRQAKNRQFDKRHDCDGGAKNSEWLN
jgi:hypothetical protein